MNMHFSDDIKNALLKREALPIINPSSGEKKLAPIDQQWLKFLGHAMVKTVIFSNFNGNDGQAKKIADSLTTKLGGRKMAYGFTSHPDNSVAGKSDSIMALRGKLGTKTRFPGTDVQIETGLKHRDTDMLKDDSNKQHSHPAVVIARAANNVKESMDFLPENEKKAYYMGNLILMNDDKIADLVGSDPAEVTGGSAFILTGYNPEYGTMQWEEITPGAESHEDPFPFDLDK